MSIHANTGQSIGGIFGLRASMMMLPSPCGSVPSRTNVVGSLDRTLIVLFRPIGCSALPQHPCENPRQRPEKRSYALRHYVSCQALTLAVCCRRHGIFRHSLGCHRARQGRAANLRRAATCPRSSGQTCMVTCPSPVRKQPLSIPLAHVSGPTSRSTLTLESSQLQS